MKADVYLKCFGVNGSNSKAPGACPSFGGSIVIRNPSKDEPIVFRIFGGAEQCSGRMRAHLTGGLVVCSVIDTLPQNITAVHIYSDEGAFIGNGQKPAQRAKELDLWAELDAALKPYRVAWDFASAETTPHLQIAGAFGKGAKGGPFVVREETASAPKYRPYRPTFEVAR